MIRSCSRACEVRTTVGLAGRPNRPEKLMGLAGAPRATTISSLFVEPILLLLSTMHRPRTDRRHLSRRKQAQGLQGGVSGGGEGAKRRRRTTIACVSEWNLAALSASSSAILGVEMQPANAKHLVASFYRSLSSCLVVSARLPPLPFAPFALVSPRCVAFAFRHR
ncbi:hypothetical protein BJY59DRAFT_442749 [Rhodotorula toruloides]